MTSNWGRKRAKSSRMAARPTTGVIGMLFSDHEQYATRHVPSSCQVRSGSMPPSSVRHTGPDHGSAGALAW